MVDVLATGQTDHRQGRDHTIHAATPGYVRYYSDPARHPKHKFIGVALEKEQQLPAPANAPRKRRLGMLAYQMPTRDALSETEDALPERTPTRKRPAHPIKPGMRPGYQYRIGNWEIGREAERVGTAQRTVPFQPGNRWIAWRRRNERKAEAIARRALGRGGKGGKKK